MESKKFDLSRYNRVFVGPDEQGWYFAYILEFPGCLTQGRSATEVNENIKKAAESWVEVALELGQEIPKPLPKAFPHSAGEEEG